MYESYGDFISGTVGTLWVGASLFFIYVAYLSQKQQMYYQKLELIDQNQTLSQQRFESTFFQLVNSLNSIINSLETSEKKVDYTGLVNGRRIVKGRRCFRVFYSDFKSKIKHSGALPIEIAEVAGFTINESIKGYDELYKSEMSSLSHYFRTLYHIVKFIAKSDIEDKYQYTSIVRAQLSSYEQILLFYNCLHDYGKEKFKPLIETYAIFKNIDTELLINIEHKNEYGIGAYEYIKKR